MAAVDFNSLFESSPDAYLILEPNPPKYTICAVSDAYLKATMTEREAIVGKELFEIFPDNPDDPEADGEMNLNASLKTVIATKAPHKMAIQKYDIRRPDGTFEVRYWQPVNSPALGDGGEVAYIIHRVEDVTELLALKEQVGHKKGRATKLGEFFIDRAVAVALVVFIQFLSIGVVATGIAASNRHSNEQRADLRENFNRQLDELKAGQALTRDCSSPGGKCFEEQIRSSSVGAALGSISGSVIVMMECVGPIPIEDRSEARLADCRKKAWEYQAAVVEQIKRDKK